MNAATHEPWYRQFWVWFMLAPLIATVAASMVTLFLAGSGPDLVNDDAPAAPAPREAQAPADGH